MTSEKRALTPARLGVQLALLAAIVACANAAMVALSRNAKPRQILRQVRETPHPTDLFLGNSLVADAVDTTVLDRARPGVRALNLGLGASSTVEHYVLLRRTADEPGQRLYYGFFDLLLTDPVEGDWDTLVGNRAMSYYVDPDVALRFYAQGDPLRAARFELVRWVPMLVERSLIWAHVEKLRRRLAGFGLRKQKSYRYGDADNFTLLEAASEEDFDRQCREGIVRPLNPAITAIMERARQRGAIITVIEMPVPGRHRRAFYDRTEWRAYEAHVEALLAPYGARLVRAADWVSDDYFQDALHLSPAGATVFSRRLAAQAVFGGRQLSGAKSSP